MAAVDCVVCKGNPCCCQVNKDVVKFGTDPGRPVWLKALGKHKVIPAIAKADLDILDPGIFPATGVPEPGGLNFNELLDILYYFKSLNILGIDLSEYNPLIDPSGHCAVIAAKLIREIILLFGWVFLSKKKRNQGQMLSK